jgi:hypothetical protein
MRSSKRLIAFLAVGLLALWAGMLLGMTTPQKRGSYWQMKPLTVNALPQDGLLIVGPEDSSFAEALRACSSGEEALPRNALRFSVVVSNNTDQPVAAIAVAWEFIQPDGRVIRREKIGREASLFGEDDTLTDLGVRLGLLPSHTARHVLEPHSSRLFSLVSNLSLGSASESSVGSGSTVGSGAATGIRRTSQRLDPTVMREQEIDILETLLQNSVSWRVSIDGAFFEDGRFAGAKKGDFFAKITAERKSRIDLLNELRKLIQEGKRSEDFTKLFTHIESVAGSQRPNLRGMNASDFYDFRKSIFAWRLIEIRKRAGDQTIIDFVTRESNRL